MIKFVSDLRQVSGFLCILRFTPPIKLFVKLLKVALNTINHLNLIWFLKGSKNPGIRYLYVISHLLLLYCMYIYVFLLNLQVCHTTDRQSNIWYFLYLLFKRVLDILLILSLALCSTVCMVNFAGVKFCDFWITNHSPGD